MRFGFSAAAIAACGVMVGCGSSPATIGNTRDGGVDDGTSGLQPEGHDTNPDGVAYPTRNLGYSARGVDANGKPKRVPGNVIRNYKFMGYPMGDRSKGLQTVALADFFDPDGKNFTIIHIAAAGVWCTPCNQETDALVPVVPGLARKGVVFLQALAEGTVENVAATSTDLDRWMDTHHTNFTEVLDPLERNLGLFWDTNVLPWNADIDARTMEVLASGTGYEEPAANVQRWLDWQAANPPAQF